MPQHPLRFAYGLVFVTSFLYFYLPQEIKVGEFFVSKLVLIGLFSAWIVYELLFVEYDVEDFIMFVFSLLSVPALLLLSNGLNQGFFLLVIYLAVGIYLNVKKKRLGWS